MKNVLEEIIAENFPNLKKETDSQVQEAHACTCAQGAQRVPDKMNPNPNPNPNPSYMHAI